MELSMLFEMQRLKEEELEKLAAKANADAKEYDNNKKPIVNKAKK